MNFIEDFIDFIKFMPVPATLMILVPVIIILIDVDVKEYECRQYQNITGRNTKYECATCYVQTETGWYTQDEYSNIIVAKEGLKDE